MQVKSIFWLCQWVLHRGLPCYCSVMFHIVPSYCSIWSHWFIRKKLYCSFCSVNFGVCEENAGSFAGNLSLAGGLNSFRRSFLYIQFHMEQYLFINNLHNLNTRTNTDIIDTTLFVRLRYAIPQPTTVYLTLIGKSVKIYIVGKEILVWSRDKQPCV